jgi:hypothetical protein
MRSDQDDFPTRMGVCAKEFFGCKSRPKSPAPLLTYARRSLAPALVGEILAVAGTRSSPLLSSVP